MLIIYSLSDSNNQQLLFSISVIDENYGNVIEAIQNNADNACDKAGVNSLTKRED